MKQLRFYQKDINKSVNQFLMNPINGQRGMVYAPTGSGKTECFLHTVQDLAVYVRMTLQREARICVVHPRIALSQDQLRRFKDEFGGVRYTSFHSGDHEIGSEEVREQNTTRIEVLNRIIAESADLPHITFSSYDSLHKLVEVEQPFDLMICDEAHNLVQEQHFDTIRSIRASKVLFYTATPVVIDGEDETKLGMDDQEAFGDVIAQVEPKVLFPHGYIVKPMVHMMRATTDRSTDNADVVKIVAEAFMFQSEHQVNNGMPYHQMLVATAGSGHIAEINENIQRIWELTDRNVDVVTIMAAECYYNGVRHHDSNRQVLLERVKNSGRNAIICHYDTLAEGIDIDTLSGALLLRNLSQPKLIQTIGRTCRPYKNDYNADGSGEIDIASRKKKFSIVTAPYVDGTPIAGGRQMEELVEAFKVAGYGDLTTYILPDNTSDPVVDETNDDDDNDGEDADNRYADVIDIQNQLLLDELEEELMV